MPEDKRTSGGPAAKPDVASFDDETVSRDSERGRKLAEDAQLAREFSRYGSTDSIPWVMLSDAAVRARSLDERAVLVLSQVDGRRSVSSIVGLCSVPGAEVLATLVSLAKKGVVAFR
jgi:hypothetical protein